MGMHCCSGDVRRVPPGNQSRSSKFVKSMKKCLNVVNAPIDGMLELFSENFFSFNFAILMPMLDKHFHIKTGHVFSNLSSLR